MDFLSLPPLPTVVDPDFYDDHYLENTLPSFLPQFYIPSLEDKPQDPIVTTLLARKKKAEKEPRHLNGILKKTTGAATVVNVEDEISGDDDLFTPDLGPVPQEPLVSWDALFSGTVPSPRPRLPALLTEQHMDVSTAARELVFSEPFPGSLHVDSETLRDALQAMVYGNASPLFHWKRDVEQFELGVDIAGLVVDDLTQSSTRSIVQHFMTIGTLLRRLQSFVLLNRLRKASHELHSLVHCIDVALAVIIGNLSKRLLSTRLLGGCTGYAEERDILVALGDLCHRSMDLYPQYPPLPASRNELLDHVYNHASLHVHSFSTSKPLSALFAYILPRTSSQWLRHVSIRTGLVASLLPSEEPVSFPSFIPARERKQIARGIKSLEILRIARPDHPVCQAPQNATSSSHGWAWTPEGVEEVVSHLEQHLARVKKQVAAWRKGSKRLQEATQANTTPVEKVVEPPETPEVDSMYGPELAGLAKFDLEPGVSIGITQEVAHAELRSLEQTIASFPDSLPPATPTLQSITQTTVIEPLSAHCRLLSSSLLGLYLTSLHLLSHLDVLHRFMLFGDPSFVANLRAALFDERPNLPGQPAAGLNPKLSHDGQWPPGGWDLSVSLRRVVADALQHEVEREDMLPEERAVWEEAEARTGFIIIPGDESEDGSERVAWSDPWNIDAVRFLRLVYKPPPTLDIIITPDIIGKYQRVFDFLLSLLRVDTVARSIFLLAQNKDGASPFKHDNRSTKLLERFSRQIQSFTQSLIGYVFDSAINSHWKTFTCRLQDLKSEYSSTGLRRSQTAHSNEEEEDQELHDVFSILDYHTDVLDKILTACLLKARLNSANAALRRPLNTVLALARLCKDLNEGRRSAEKAASMLVDLHRHWNASMKNLTSILRGLDARGHGHQTSSSQLSGEHDLNILRGGTTSSDLGAGDLLLRLDPTGWYAKQES